MPVDSWWECCIGPSQHYVGNTEAAHTLFTSLRAVLAKLKVLRVSWTDTSEGLTFAMITVLALPPMESCKQQAGGSDRPASAAGIVTSPLNLQLKHCC